MDNSHNCYSHNCVLPHWPHWLWHVDNSHNFCRVFLCELCGLHCVVGSSYFVIISMPIYTEHLQLFLWCIAKMSTFMFNNTLPIKRQQTLKAAFAAANDQCGFVNLLHVVHWFFYHQIAKLSRNKAFIDLHFVGHFGNAGELLSQLCLNSSRNYRTWGTLYLWLFTFVCNLCRWFLFVFITGWQLSFEVGFGCWHLFIDVPIHSSMGLDSLLENCGIVDERIWRGLWLVLYQMLVTIFRLTFNRPCGVCVGRCRVQRAWFLGFLLFRFLICICLWQFIMSVNVVFKILNDNITM